MDGTMKLAMVALVITMALFGMIAFAEPDHAVAHKTVKQINAEVLAQEAADKAIAEKAVSGWVGTQYYNPITGEWQCEPIEQETSI